jgi:hypothetical protein
MARQLPSLLVAITALALPPRSSRERRRVFITGAVIRNWLRWEA